MEINLASVEKYHLRTADAYRCAPAPAHSSPENPSNIKSQSSSTSQISFAGFSPTIISPTTIEKRTNQCIGCLAHR